MYYKKQKLRGKWYPRSVTRGIVRTDSVARMLSRMSSVTEGDTYAVLVGLGEVLGDLMESGQSVKLKGLGTFFLVGKAKGRGVDTPEEVTARQFEGVAVRFIPEYRRNSSGKVMKRTLVPRKVEWVEV